MPVVDQFEPLSNGYAGFYWGTDPTLSTYTLQCGSYGWYSCPQ
jgi:hypothetical protein